MSDLFTEETEKDTNKDTQNTGTNSHLAMLVGPERKYKDEETLAKSMLHLEEHSAKLEEELREAREKLAKASTVDDVLKRLDSRKASEREDSPLSSELKLTQADLERIVEKTVTGRETAKTRETNRNMVNQKMTEMFGDKALDKLKAKANSPALLKVYQDLAETSPNDFLALFTDKDSRSTTTSQASGAGTMSSEYAQRTVSVTDSSVQGTKAYYNEMRRKNPNKFYSRAVQMEIMKVSSENPELYYGRKS